MITDFTYNDIVLYCKGWYQRTNVIDDLAYLFSKVYGWAPENETEVAKMMLRVIDKLYEAKEVKFSDSHGFSSFYDRVQNNMRLYESSFDMAVIRNCMSVLMELPREEIKLNPPHFGKKEHFRLGMLLGSYPISQTYTEMNRIVKKSFE